MLSEFYNFIAKRIFSYFLLQSEQSNIHPAESFCLKLDDNEMVKNVASTLKEILEQNNCKGEYKYRCMDGSVYSTFTIEAKDDIEVIVAVQDISMTSEFLGATLRNAANEAGKPLLMITANPNDSAISGSRNMAASGMPFHSARLVDDIKKVIQNNSKLTEVEKAILDFEVGRREEDVFSDKSSLYEYRELLAIVSSGRIDDSIFPGFRLFSINGKTDFREKNKSQIKKEIKRDNELFERIDRSIRFGNLENDLSNDFEESFIKRINDNKKKNVDQWSQSITYHQVLQSMEKRQTEKDKPLQIDNKNISAYKGVPFNPLVQDEELFIRNEGSQKAKKRLKNLLLFNIDSYPEISIRIECNIRLKKDNITKSEGDFERDNKNLIFRFMSKSVGFYRITLKDEANKITYIFKICILELRPSYLIPTIRNMFVVHLKGKKRDNRIHLIGVGTDLSFNQEGEVVRSEKLEDNHDYFCDYKTRLNLFAAEDELTNSADGIRISVSFASVEVPFILFPDQAKSLEITGKRILREKYAAESSFVLSEDNSILRNNQEYFAKENLQREINLENNIIHDGIFMGRVDNYYFECNPTIATEKLDISQELSDAYLSLLDAYKNIESTQLWHISEKNGF